MAMRWSCWRRGCPWRPAAFGSPRPGRPGCAGPLGTRATSDTRAQVRPGRACCPRRRGHGANDSRRLNEWEDAHVRRACSPPWVGRQGSGTSRGARSAEHPGHIEAEVGEAAERSPHKRDAGATGVCRDDSSFRRCNQRQRDLCSHFPSNFGFRIQLASKFGKGVVATQSNASQGGLDFNAVYAY